MNGTDTYATKYVIDGENNNKIVDWPANPMVAGYIFDGWYKDNIQYTSGSSFDSSIVLTAKFNVVSIPSGTIATLNSSDVTMSSANDLIKSGYFFVSDTTDKITVDSSGFKFGTNGSTTANFIMFNIPAYSKAVIDITGRSGSNGNAASIAVDDGTEHTMTFTAASYSGDAEVSNLIVLNHASVDKSIYIYRNGGKTVKVSKVEVGVSALMNVNTTASVDAEINSTGNTLRFIGTITGITDLGNVSEIELILYYNTKKSKDDIILTSCYTSIANASKTYAQADSTYYVVFRLNGVSGITGTFNKQLKITFTDGSTTLSDATDFVL